MPYTQIGGDNREDGDDRDRSRDSNVMAYTYSKSLE